MRHPTTQTTIELGEFADPYLRPFSSVSHLSGGSQKFKNPWRGLFSVDKTKFFITLREHIYVKHKSHQEETPWKARKIYFVKHGFTL